MNIQIPNAEARELAFEDESDNYIAVENKQIGNSRWSIHYSLVIKSKTEDRYYATTYSRGATEQQEERPFEYDGELITFSEVVPKETKIIEYIAI